MEAQMSERNNNVCVSIYDFQPDHLYSEDEIAELRKEAWVDLGIPQSSHRMRLRAFVKQG